MFNYEKKIVVLTDSCNSEQLTIGQMCHDLGIKFIAADTKGVFG